MHNVQPRMHGTCATSHLGHSWGVLRLLGPSWSRPGPSMGPLVGFLGRHETVLGAACRPIGPSWNGIRGRLGPSGTFGGDRPVAPSARHLSTARALSFEEGGARLRAAPVGGPMDRAWISSSSTIARASTLIAKCGCCACARMAHETK